MKIAYGTDSGVYPHKDVGRQFAYMVRHGMTPMQAIRSATIVSAELLRASDDLGSVEPGKFADLVAVAGDPLDDISRARGRRVRDEGRRGREGRQGVSRPAPAHPRTTAYVPGR